jgi:hypothetical protein
MMHGLYGYLRYGKGFGPDRTRVAYPCYHVTVFCLAMASSVSRHQGHNSAVLLVIS